MNKNYHTIFVFLCSNVNFLHHIAKDYLAGSEKLYKENYSNNSIYSFCFLTTTSLELFLKVIIAADLCLKEKCNNHTDESIKEIIISELRKSRHNIEKLIYQSQIIDQFKITKVEKFHNGFVNDYRLHFVNGNVLYFKDSESIRFGSLAEKPDLAIFSQVYYTNQVMSFLSDLSRFSFERLNEAINSFKEID